MKHSIILGVIAVALLVIYGTVMSHVLLPIISFVLFIIAINEYYRRHRNSDDKVRPFEKNVEDLTADYGEPEDVIILNATRGNEAMGVILVYKDFLVIEGNRIEKNDITGVTFNNSGTPYARGEYQVIIAIRQGEDFLHVNTGYDAAWTKDVVEEIKKNL